MRNHHAGLLAAGPALKGRPLPCSVLRAQRPVLRWLSKIQLLCVRAGVGSKVVCKQGKCRLCQCARVRVFDPCNPPSADEEWNEWGSCGPECIPDGEEKLEGVEKT